MEEEKRKAYSEVVEILKRVKILLQIIIIRKHLGKKEVIILKVKVKHSNLVKLVILL